MAERAKASDPGMVILDGDHDFTYFAHSEDETSVRDLANGISERGIVAAIARPIRLMKFNRLTGISINPGAGDEEGYAEIVRPLNSVELAHKLAQTDKAEG